MLKLIDLKPIIAACSSEVLCKSLQTKLDEAGFESFYEVPLKSGIIKDQIIPKLEERKKNLDQKLNLKKLRQSSLGGRCIQSKIKLYKSVVESKVNLNQE